MKLLKSLQRQMSPELKQVLEEGVKPFPVKKGDLIPKQSATHNDLYFVEKGLIRRFYHIERRQKTHSFQKENDFILDLRLPGKYPKLKDDAYEAIEDSLIWIFPGTLFERETPCHIEFLNYWCIIMEKDWAKLEERNSLAQIKSVTEWYNYIRGKTSDLLERVPMKYLASYAGTSTKIFTHIHKSGLQLNMMSTRRRAKKEK